MRKSTPAFFEIMPFQSGDESQIRAMLERIGWEDGYIRAFEQTALDFSQRSFYEAVGYRAGYVMPRYYEDTLDGVTYQKFYDTSV